MMTDGSIIDIGKKRGLCLLRQYHLKLATSASASLLGFHVASLCPRPTMLASRASAALRCASRLAPRRDLAIMPTVKVASDTSKMEFPAPSHVSLSSQAADMARQLTDFYTNPDSVLSLSDEDKQIVREELAKRVQGIPGVEKPDSIVAGLDIPTEVRIGDSPLFEALSKKRTA